MTEVLEDYSLIAVYAAMAIYTLAFIAYTVDLAKRSAPAAAVGGAGAANAANARAVGGRATALLERLATDAPPAEGAPPAASAAQRTATALVVIGWVLQVTADVLRGLAAGRVPWANLYEFTLTATAIAMGVYLIFGLFQPIRFLGAYITGIVLVLLGLATVNFYVPVTPLPPPLQSYWLVIHVFVASLGTGIFAIGAGLSIAQLLQARRESRGTGLGFLATLPGSTSLENLAYRVILVGFVFWTFTLIAGAIWADHAWGRYWGWDTKEVWTFIIWVVFAGYIHARATRGWRGSRSAVLAIIGFGAVIFNFTIVNLFFKGLHSYSGL
ncbi:c-type cytochrome biogenesis protein CcsB [Galbitalea sp. SE-J8]|uniref:c-type cytochrome biogenesis protein CcsB n=1 Tax=Galbitalea sp. SE-J8 TaxID=3054952 RepID=UPI00259CDDB6|nr:c-type cytochrome biogenesis protein CcsB [Galbitalea sp. SE-J8]MDM4762395.1 c-type cytochrome biogenesis protein CcsB [Galbitalea sp. SE-J8]